MTPEEEVIRANKAAQILEEPLLKEAFSVMEAAFIQTIQTSALKDHELREKCCMLLMCLSQTKQHLKSTMETGQLAKRQIADKFGKVKAFFQ